MVMVTVTVIVDLFSSPLLRSQYAFYAFYAWWVYFPQSGGTSRPVSHKHDQA